LTRDQFFIANTLMCRPPGNRDPLPDEIVTCRPFLDKKLELIDPKVVVTLGNFSTKLLLDTKDGITKMRGKKYPFRRGWLVPTYRSSTLTCTGSTTCRRSSTSAWPSWSTTTPWCSSNGATSSPRASGRTISASAWSIRPQPSTAPPTIE